MGLINLHDFIENTINEFDFEFFELVPKSVYAGVEQEDIW